MINKTSKFCVLMLCVFLAFGCSKNRFKKNDDLNVFSFGLTGHDAFKFCKKTDPEFIKPYSNGEYPKKTCTRYRYYTCHVNHYCNGDKDCERDATQYWTPLWDNAHGNLEKRVEITKRSCDIEQQRNSIKNK